MVHLTDAQLIEFFHISFLDVLSKRLEGSRYILKGGANLRFFFGSVRYSEDIDLDLTGVKPPNLEEKVDRVLDSPALRALLRVRDLEVVDPSKPKQTQTTRRWKLGIVAPWRSEPVRTKVEFSARNGDDRFRLDPLPAEVVEPYALRPPTVQHYVDDAPAEQKVKALALRSETQARDVFDLDLLLRRRPLPRGTLDAETLTEAADLALRLPFAAFRDQVLPFLEPGVRELYESESSWEQMQTFVAEKLEQAR
jgi:Nucleotidyl transferase AbiEii toxin, Type IV TA system